MPFHFHAADTEQGRRLLDDHGLDCSRLPVMIRHDGYTMVKPALAQIIESVGGSTSNDVDACDIVIVGAGPAGLTAAVYAASEGLRTVVLEQTVSGGQAGSSPMIRNYPGFPHGISGHELTRRACEQAWMFGAHIVFSQPAAGLESQGATASCNGHGSDHLDALTLRDGLRNRTEQVPAAALFVLIGGEPHTQWLPGRVQREGGYILTGRDAAQAPQWPLERAPLPLETSMPGVFAAGDARYLSIKRVASAVGDGATAVRLTQEYLAMQNAVSQPTAAGVARRLAVVASYSHGVTLRKDHRPIMVSAGRLA